MKNTKFWIALGVMSALLLVLVLLVFTDQLGGNFAVWLIAFVGVPVQYGIFNVIASGQAAAKDPTAGP